MNRGILKNKSNLWKITFSSIFFPKLIHYSLITSSREDKNNITMGSLLIRISHRAPFYDSCVSLMLGSDGRRVNFRRLTPWVFYTHRNYLTFAAIIQSRIDHKTIWEHPNFTARHRTGSWNVLIFIVHNWRHVTQSSSFHLNSVRRPRFCLLAPLIL